MRGSVILTFDEFVDDLGFDSINISVAGEERYIRNIDSKKIYTTPINTGDFVEVYLNANPFPSISSRIVVTRIDYTTDDVNGDNGIKETYIGESIASSGGTFYNFSASIRPDAYAFEYRVNCYTDGCFPNNNVGFDGKVLEIISESDGKVIVGGWFTTYSGTAVNGICRLNSDGTLDTSFNFNEIFLIPGIAPTPISPQRFYCQAIVRQSDGKLVCTGQIGMYTFTFRLHSNGNLDASFYLGYTLVMLDYEESLVIQPDNKIILVGGFTQYTSNIQLFQRCIVRLNPDGTIDTTFNSGGIGFTASTAIFGIKIQSDNKILLVGEKIRNYNGTVLSSQTNGCGIVRLNPDGTLDTSFTLNTTTSNICQAINLFSDEKIMIWNLSGNSYSGYSGKLFRLNTNGTVDTSFPYGALSTGSTVSDILIDNLDNIYILGKSLNYSGTSIPSLFKIDYDGIVEGGFSDGGGFLNAFPISAGTPTDIEFNNAGSFYVGGDFDLYYNNNYISINIIKIRPNGTPFLC